ncbi:vacuolar protein sorting-associated protein 72 [Rhizoctonia solani AG-1 IB]|uniref:Vacuolar protein sorting-associated protein 72 n=1 Tax=Thanatephorus cucumeris (strain AG1-IB / isolate 7/3/14) TaxID=1108050 RepID=A0A0B7FK02_THACB|nr:vacuolar protein sorting-associated protein 72 [Rhizoctonia solani AG-1 IB]
MSLSATRSRRSNAGNRWAEALAAVQIESGDAPDLDAEAPGEEFVGKEEEDVFESDFESTDEEEYAKQGVEDGEKQVQIEEKAERRAHAPRRPRPIVAPKTQDELIAAALELEEKNTKALNEFLEKEEEKRAAARKVVRLKIEGPVIRWISRGEVPTIEEVKPERRTETPIIPSQPPVQPPVTQAFVTQAPVSHVAPVHMEVDPALIRPERSNPPDSTPSFIPTRIPTPTPNPSPNLTPARASTPVRTPRMQVYVEIPTPSKSMRRSLSSSVRGSSLAPRGKEASPSPVASRGLDVPSQPLAKSPLSSMVSLPKSPLSTCEPLLPAGNNSSQPTRPVSPRPLGLTPSTSSELVSTQPTESTPPHIDPLRAFHRPAAARQSSVSSSSSNKSKGKMVMYVEIPVRKKERSGTPASGLTGTVEPSSGGAIQELSSAPAPSTSDPIPVASSTPDHPSSSTSIVPLLVSNVLAVPSPPPNPTVSSAPKQTRNYIVVEYGGVARASFGWNMQAVFGDHADWEDVLIHGVKTLHPVKPTCVITGLPAPYRDSRTGIPYANAYAYKTLTRLLAHEFVWSKERGCYIGDEGKDPARGVPTNWRRAATGRS